MLNIIARVTHHPVGFAILVLFWPNQTTVSVDYPFSESHDPPKFLYPVKYVFQLMYSTGPLGDLWHGMWGQAQSYAYRFFNSLPTCKCLQVPSKTLPTVPVVPCAP